VPVASGIESNPLLYIESSGAVVVSSTLDLLDPDDINLERASVWIEGYLSTEDILSFTDTTQLAIHEQFLSRCSIVMQIPMLNPE